MIKIYFSVSLVIALLSFIIDIFIPDFSSVWLIYLLPIIVISYKSSKKEIIWITSIISLLMITGFIISHDEKTGLAASVPNILVGLMVYWATAYSFIKKHFTYDNPHHKELSDFNQTLLDSYPHGIGTYDSNGNCNYVNDSFCKIIGAEPEQALSQNFHSIESWKKSGLYKVALESLEKMKIITDEMKINTTFGKKIWVEIKLIPFIFAGKKNLLLVLDDISVFRELEMKLEKQRQFAESLSDFSKAISEVKLDEERILNSAVKQIHEFSGDAAAIIILSKEKNQVEKWAYYHSDDSIMKILDEIGMMEKKVEGKLITEIVNTGKPYIVQDYYSFDHSRLNPDLIEFFSKLGTSSFMLVPFYAQEVFGVMALSRNNSVMPFNEDDYTLFQEMAYFLAIKLTNSNLYKEKSKSEEVLKELNSSKDKFFSIISHDLKNPFSSLIGFAEFLMNELDILTKEEVREFSSNIYKNSKRILNLLENLLQWSRVQTGRMDLTPSLFYIQDILEEIIPLYQPLASKKRIKFDCEIDKNAKAYADKEMTAIILRNLISNALKFTGSEGKIKITSKEEDNYHLIEIADNGKGINAKDLSRLFKIEEQLTTPGTENEPGTGLGLILCKEFVEKNGGKIWAASKPGMGSTFSFTLPSQSNMKSET